MWKFLVVVLVATCVLGLPVENIEKTTDERKVGPDPLENEINEKFFEQTLPNAAADQETKNEDVFEPEEPSKTGIKDETTSLSKPDDNFEVQITGKTHKKLLSQQESQDEKVNADTIEIEPSLPAEVSEPLIRGTDQIIPLEFLYEDPISRDALEENEEEYLPFNEEQPSYMANPQDEVPTLIEEAQEIADILNKDEQLDSQEDYEAQYEEPYQRQPLIDEQPEYGMIDEDRESEDLSTDIDFVPLNDQREFSAESEYPQQPGNTKDVDNVDETQLGYKSKELHPGRAEMNDDNLPLDEEDPIDDYDIVFSNNEQTMDAISSMNDETPTYDAENQDQEIMAEPFLSNDEMDYIDEGAYPQISEFIDEMPSVPGEDPDFINPMNDYQGTGPQNLMYLPLDQTRYSPLYDGYPVIKDHNQRVYVIDEHPTLMIYSGNPNEKRYEDQAMGYNSDFAYKNAPQNYPIYNNEDGLGAGPYDVDLDQETDPSMSGMSVHEEDPAVFENMPHSEYDFEDGRDNRHMGLATYFGYHSVGAPFEEYFSSIESEHEDIYDPGFIDYDDMRPDRRFNPEMQEHNFESMPHSPIMTPYSYSSSGIDGSNARPYFYNPLLGSLFPNRNMRPKSSLSAPYITYEINRGPQTPAYQSLSNNNFHPFPFSTITIKKIDAPINEKETDVSQTDIKEEENADAPKKAKTEKRKASIEPEMSTDTKDTNSNLKENLEVIDANLNSDLRNEFGGRPFFNMRYYGFDGAFNSGPHTANNKGGYGRPGPYTSNNKGGYGGPGPYTSNNKGGYGGPGPYSSNNKGGYGGPGPYTSNNKGGYGGPGPYTSNNKGGYGGPGPYTSNNKGGYGGPGPYTSNNKGGYGGPGPYTSNNKGGYGGPGPYGGHGPYGGPGLYGLNYSDQAYLYSLISRDNRLRYLLHKAFGI